MKPLNRIKEVGTGGHHRAFDHFLNHRPGHPLELIYGSEAPVRLSDVTRHLSSARKRRIDHIAFFGCRFQTPDGVEGRGDPADAAPFFRALGRKLRRVSVSGGLSICGMPNVGDDEVESLAPFFDEGTISSSGRGASSLRSLDLTGSRITAKVIKGGPLGRFFRRSSSLEALAMGENPGLGDEGATAVAEALMCGGGRLRHLSLEGCGISDVGACSISAYLGNRTTVLHVLELGRNDVGDYGALSIAAAIRSNRSLVRLGLNEGGISDVGASGLLESIFDDASIERIVRSNHVLKDIDLRGCSGMSSHLLQKAIHISAIARSQWTEEEIIRLKVSAHIKNSHCGVVLEEYDLELMPHILAFVGKTCGMTSLFNTLQNMPNIYSKNDSLKCLAEDVPITEDEQHKEKNTPFLDQSNLSPRKTKRFYTSFADRIPRRCSMLRHQNCRVRNGHKFAFDDSPGKKNSRCNLSLDCFNTTDALFKLHVHRCCVCH
ncbi:hypothetical protein ACHAXA_003632 [Cyclostephanos tholiformis]|uniref:Uncharacterized protein n=1 Tax=Cyclostephanos tholiformis TaxID=382380 RepID=A0ABD3SQ32_9STRA